MVIIIELNIIMLNKKNIFYLTKYDFIFFLLIFITF